MSNFFLFARNCNKVGRRWNSTFADLVKSVKHGDDLDLAKVKTVLESRSFKPEEITALKELLNPNNSNDAVNELLHFALPQDFSIYFSLLKERPSHEWNDHALVSLLKSNPGRVYSLTDLMKKHGHSSVGEEVRKVIILKLLYGEKAEVHDGEFQLTDGNISEAIVHLNKFGDVAQVTDFLNTIIDHAIEKGAYALMSDINIRGYANWLAEHKVKEVKNKEAFLRLTEIVFNQSPQNLAKHILSDILALEDKELYQRKSEFFDRVLSYIVENQLDLDKRDAESLLLRIQLIATYGINKDRIDVALEKFHYYQSHEKSGIELVQTKLVQAFCYQSFAKSDPTFLKIAESLIVVDELPVKTIAQLILASSKTEGKDLEIYNDYINNVSKEVNEKTKRSASGILTEAMMIASLYGNDREFAQLLFEKAVENKIISDEMEIATLRKLFKVYGDAFEEDSWESAKPKLEKYVLDTIKQY